MTITHYPKMTEKQLSHLANDLVHRCHLLDLLIVHRVGKVMPTEPLVLIAATAVHRRNAITAVEQALEALKHRAPFWKKEQIGEQTRWVAANTQNKIHNTESYAGKGDEGKDDTGEIQ